MILNELATISAFIFDVDGVFTSGTVLATDEGSMNRDFNIKDGYAVHRAISQGYPIIIISGGNSEGVRKRLKGLGVKHVYTAISDKKAHLKKLEQELGLELSTTLYMGDDMPDIPVMQLCGVKVAPADAAWQVQVCADLVTKAKGGKGAIREILETVMVLQNKWDGDDQYVW